MNNLKKKDGPEAALSMRYCTTKKTTSSYVG
jgi:hypothetical protein